MAGPVLHTGLGLLLLCIITDAALDATTFTNIAYKRGVAHRKGITVNQCIALCERRTECWGINYVGGVMSKRGECQLLYNSIATCDPTSHRRMPTHLNAKAIWVRGSCPLQRKMFGQNSAFRTISGKSFFSDDPCNGHIVQWKVHDDAHVIDGAYISGPRTFLDCLDSCALHVDCTAVDYNFDYDACFHFGTADTVKDTYQQKEDGCCAHAVIECDDTGRTTPPVETTTTSPPGITSTTSRPGPTGGATRPSYSRPPTKGTPPTTAPPGVTAKPFVMSDRKIPDSGCPGPYIKFPKSGRPGGNPILSLPSNTSEACKQYCLELGDECTGIDYDNDVSVCYTFNTPDPQNLPRGKRPCCDHYTKLQCDNLMARTCYQHGPLLFLANPNEHNVIVSAMPPLAPPDLAIVPCEGVCYQNLDHDPDFGFFSLSRGCNTSLGSGQSWRSCVGSGDRFIHDKNCSCAWDRCNAVNTFLFDHLTSHYSFNGHVKDESGFRRHGRAFNIHYDPVTAIRAYSAQFDGESSYVHFPSWHLVHSEHIGPDGTPLLSFTIAMWLLRPQDTTGSMTVLSTFTRDLSSIQILSEMDVSDPWKPKQTIKASVIVNHTQYEIMAPAPVDEWFFIAFTLDGFRDTPLLALDINDLENIIPEASLEMTGVTALSELTMTPGGLYIGKQAEIIRGLDEPYFFKGHIDDVFCYDKALSYHELLALRDLSLPLP